MPQHFADVVQVVVRTRRRGVGLRDRRRLVGRQRKRQDGRRDRSSRCTMPAQHRFGQPWREVDGERVVGAERIADRRLRAGCAETARARRLAIVDAQRAGPVEQQLGARFQCRAQPRAQGRVARVPPPSRSKDAASRDAYAPRYHSRAPPASSRIVSGRGALCASNSRRKRSSRRRASGTLSVSTVNARSRSNCSYQRGCSCCRRASGSREKPSFSRSSTTTGRT